MHEENSLIKGKTRGRGCKLVRTRITRIIGSVNVPLVQNNRRTDIDAVADERRLAVHCKSKQYTTRSHTNTYDSSVCCWRAYNY